MNINKKKMSILRVVSIFFILIILFAGSPIWTASAQDSPTETPNEVPVETPTPQEIITPVIPSQETEVPTQAATEPPAPTDQINVAPTISIIQPNKDISVAQGGSLMIQWEDEDPDDNALISIFISHFENDVINEESILIANNIEEDSDGNSDEYLWDTEKIRVGVYELRLSIKDEANNEEYSESILVTVLENVEKESEEIVFDDKALIERLRMLYSVSAGVNVSIQRLGWNSDSLLGVFVISPEDYDSSPNIHYFIAQNKDNEILIGGEYTSEFYNMLSDLEGTNVIIDDYKNLFLFSTLGDGSTLLSLPWKTSTNATYTQGPHVSSSSSTALSSLDFVPSDNRVYSARDGFAQQIICSGYSRSSLVIVTSSDGWRTNYYHITNPQVSTSGRQVSRNEYLGDLALNSTDALQCGGGWTGPHVHFSLLKNGVHVSVVGVDIGGWTVGGSGIDGTLTRISDGAIRYAKSGLNRTVYNDGTIGSGSNPPPPSTCPASTSTQVHVCKPTLSPAYTNTCSSYWYPFTGYNGNTAYLTENAYTASQSSNSGTWTPNLPSTGKYKVEAYIAYHGTANVGCSWGTASYGSDTSNARYLIYKTSSSSPVTVIKDQLPYNNQWVSLGEFDFNAGTGGFVKLTDLTGETYTSRNVSFSAMRFTLVSTNNPVPTTSSISPTIKYVGDGSFTLTVYGTNFVNGSIVRWNGSNRTTTFVSNTQLNASIAASDIASTGSATITVFNPTPGGGTSNSKTLTINYPAPAITSISPTSKIIGEAAFTLTVNGTGFVSGSVVRWNGSNRTTAYVSSTKLTASITATDIANVGTSNVTVYNPTPGGGTSNAASLSINYPVPIISSISPTIKETGDSGFTLTVNGGNFVSGSVVRWNGSNRTTTYVSNSKLTASISAADIASVGNVNVTVYTPTPGGGISNTVNLQINYPVPQISSIMPNTISTGESGFVLTIYGSKFVNGSVVKWNGSNRTTTYINPSQLTASIPASDIVNSGVNNVTVFNPTPGGGTSASFVFTVVTRRPSQNEILLTTQPTFICPSVTNAAMYNLQVSTSSSFGSYLINQTFADPNYSLKTDLPRGQQLFWRTRAQVNGVWGEWSDTWSFTSANSPTTPTLVAPGNNALATDPRPKLDWSNSSLPVDAVFSHYHLQVSSDNQFSNLSVNENIYGQSSSEFFPPEDLNSNSKYYWRVRAFNTNGQYSAWSTTWYFREAILAPDMLSPLDGAFSENLRPSFDWSDSIGAESFTIQISLFSNFKELKVNTTVAGSQYMPTTDLLVKSTFYWRVRANGANGPSLWSEVWTFNTPNPPGKPSLLLPADNALIRDYTPRLDWSTSTLPSGTSFGYYRMQIAWDRSFNDLLLDTQVSPLSNSEFTLPDDLQANTQYYWRVMAVNSAGQYRSWSAVRTFRTAIIPPLLINPGFASVESTLRPFFDWEDVEGASSYQIQISRYSNMKYPIINVTMASSEYLIVKNLPMNKDIYWRVRAKGANGPSAWSPISSFIINIY